jgi:DNA-binding transcriptional MerR regulator
MIIYEDKIYRKSDLIRLLEFHGLGCSYPTIIRYEKIGLITSPRSDKPGLKDRARVYTGAQLIDIVERVKNYESSKTKGKKVIYGIRKK